MNPRPPIAGASQVDNDLRSVSHVELGQHTLHVGFYRALANEQLLGDIGVRVAVGHEHEHFLFACSQFGDRG